MSKKWMLLTLIASLAAPGVLHAGSLDSSDIVYIDRQPCNSACQSYMDWSARAQATRYRGNYPTRVAVPEVACERPVAARPLRMSRTPARSASMMSRSSMAMPKARAAMARNDAIAAAPAAMEAPAAARPTITVESIRAAAAAMAPSAVEAPAAARPTITVESIRAAMASAPSAVQDNLVALVLAPQDINSLSDLNNKRIAIAEKQSALSGRVSAALMAAGAAEVQFSEASGSAIDRLTNGEATAAVVLAPREIAALFPEMAGFRTFRIPLAQKMPM